MTKRLLFAFCFLVISEALVFADQCTFLSNPTQVANVFRYLKEGETIYEYCAPFGDRIASPVVVKQLRVRKVSIEPPHSELRDAPGYKTVAFLLRHPLGEEYTFDDGISYGICPVGVVIGNHDLYAYDKRYPSEDLWTKVLPSIVKKLGLVWMEEENIVINGTAFVGTL